MSCCPVFFFLKSTATTESYTYCHPLSLPDALSIPDTLEGGVYARLLEKLEAARAALGGRVYDVLGELFEGTPLRDLLFEAIQYGEQEEVRARLFRQVDGAVDQQHLLELLKQIGRASCRERVCQYV